MCTAIKVIIFTNESPGPDRYFFKPCFFSGPRLEPKTWQVYLKQVLRGKEPVLQTLCLRHLTP
ncbi:hypothetical protein X474_15670 [Dethiosulfatarculus sandiegensis]|uniref:Uncharacterized protein n=1 Tax=Dethiosulfatarculus sandiegensis TaxID=1429043 RepID=A0A0D2HRH0_9BACT|nr:hypothetical protein X474_15670 [Dethiosulfatarculus sandiegensis]